MIDLVLLTDKIVDVCVSPFVGTIPNYDLEVN